MSNNYYYLVAGLPDISLDNEKPLASNQLVQEIVEHVQSSDQALVRSVLLWFDNQNLIRIIQNRKEAFDPRGNYSLEELESALRDPDAFPQYIQTFVEAYRESHVLFPDTSLEDTLNWLYFEEMLGSSNAFVREWFTFELDLRNVLAGVNARRISSDRTVRDVGGLGLIGKNDTTDAILRSSAPDFSLSGSLPWIERVVSLPFDNLLERERQVDAIRWETLDEMTTFSYFGIERVVSFVIKLTIVDRWRGLEAGLGKSKLDSLVGELAAGYQPFSESL